MPRGRDDRPAIRAFAEQQVKAYAEAVQQEDVERLALIASNMVQAGSPIEVAGALLSLAACCRAEGAVLKTHLEEKNQLLQSLLAEPRRIDQMLGLIREQSNGRETVWAVLKGPPCQAAPLGPGVAPEEICPEMPNEPVWVWLIKGSEESLVVAGTIDPPALLQAKLEREMVFQGFVESGDNADDQ